MKSSTLFCVVAIFLLVHIASGAVYDDTFTPVMTNNTQPAGYIASASSEEYTRDAYNAFDRVNEDPEGTAWSTWQTGITTGWIQLQIPAGKVARNYTIWDKRWGSQQSIAAAQAPKVFNLSGSNNGIDWTTLDSRTNVTWNTTTWEGKSFEFENFVPYSYYRLNILENNGNPSALQIGEIYLYESKSVVAAFNVSPTEGNATLWVDFTDLSVGEPTAWSWQKKALGQYAWSQFNTTQNPRVGFTEGNWSIRLNASNSESWNITSQEVWINVSPAPLIPGAPKYWVDSDKTRGAINLKVNFESLAPNASEWSWFFGDESYKTGWFNISDHTRYGAEGPSVALPNGHILWVPLWWPYANKTLLSIDGGLTWTVQSDPSSFEKILYTPAMVALPNGHVLLMGGIDWWTGDESARVYRTVDEGITWEEMTPTFYPRDYCDWTHDDCGGAEWWPREGFGATALADGSVIIGGGYQREIQQDIGDVWRSTDEGATWIQMSDPQIIDEYHNAIGGGAEWAMYNDTCWGREELDFVELPDESILMLGGYGCEYPGGDVWKSTDKGAHWTLINSSAGFGEVTSACVSVSPTGTVLIAYGDGYWRQAWKSEDGGYTWTQQTAQGQAPGIDICFGPGYLPDGKFVIVSGYKGSSQYVKTSWVSENDGASWYELNTSAMWSPRSSIMSTVLPNGNIVNIGGYTNTYTKDIWMSSDTGAHWSKLSDGAEFPARVWGTAETLNDGSIIVMGGHGYDFSYMNDVWRSTNGGINWTEITPHMWMKDGWEMMGGAEWSPRDFHATTVQPDGSIVLLGGVDNEIGNPNDVWRSTNGGVNWTQMKPNDGNGWGGLESPELVSMSDGDLILIAGYGPGTYPSETWKSSDNGTTWVLQNGSCGWPGRENPNVVVTSNDRIILHGGNRYTGQRYNDTWISDDEGLTWTQLASNSLRTAREDSTMVMLPGEVLVDMGGDAAPLYIDENDVWVSTDEGRTWVQTYGNGLLPIYGDNTISGMHDGSVISIGGYSSPSWDPTNEVWRSINNGETWTKVYPTGASGITTHWGHCAVVLSDDSIVAMGGASGSSYLNDTWISTNYGVNWTLQNSSSGWNNRQYMGCAALSDDAIIIGGGIDQTTNPDTNYNDVWISTDRGVTWVRQTNAAWDIGREDIDIVALSDDTLVTAGGWSAEDEYALNDSWMSTDRGITWTRQSYGVEWLERDFPNMVALPDDSIIMAGGYTLVPNDQSKEVWRSTNKGMNWTRLADANWNPVEDTRMTLLANGKVLIFGGFAPDGDPLNPPWIIDFAGSHLENPTHIYANDGTYDVTLQAVNATTTKSVIKEDYIKSADGIFTANATMGLSPLEVNFTDLCETPHFQHWERQTNTAWGDNGRYLHASAIQPDGSIVMAGGYYSATAHNDVWRSTDKGQNWTLMTEHAAWSDRWGHGLVALPDNSLVLVGGGQTGPTYYNDSWRSTDNGSTWTQQSATAGWDARRQGISVVADKYGDIYLFGGNTYTAGDYTDTWRSTDKGVTWSQRNASGGWIARRLGQGGTILPNGNLVITGGMLTGSQGWGSDVWISRDSGATWQQQTASAPWRFRGDHVTVAIPNGDLLVMGGRVEGSIAYTGPPANDVWRSRDEGKTWEEMTPTMMTYYGWDYYGGGAEWSTRDCFTAVSTNDGDVIIMGGEEGYPDYRYAPDVWRLPYDPLYQAYYPPNYSWYFGDEDFTPWTQQSTSGSGGARWSPGVTVLSNDALILVGGMISGTNNDDTWISYDYGTTWDQIDANPPWADRRAPAVVTLSNNHILLMGGYSTTWLNDVYASYGEGDGWYWVSDAADWSPRYTEAVALSNNHVIVMGGQGSSGRLNDTWRTIDEGKTWTQMNASSGWEARREFRATVQPDDSIVITGGNNEAGDYLGDVWRSTDEGTTWTLMNGSVPWTPRNTMLINSLPDGRLITMGGTDNEPAFYNDVWQSRDNGATWTQLPNANWSARWNSRSVVLSDGSIVVVGGSTGTDQEDTWRLVTAGSNERNATHTYTGNTSDTFTVSFGSQCPGSYDTKLNYITIGELSENPNDAIIPVAIWAINRLTVRVPGSVVVDDQSTNTPTSWEWSWGDGTPNSTFQEGSHTYYKRGNFPVILKVSNSAGSDTSDPQIVRAVGF